MTSVDRAAVLEAARALCEGCREGVKWLDAAHTVHLWPKDAIAEGDPKAWREQPCTAVRFIAAIRALPAAEPDGEVAKLRRLLFEARPVVERAILGQINAAALTGLVVRIDAALGETQEGGAS